jgi:bifunctional non-homologous end joining protein LigD
MIAFDSLKPMLLDERPVDMTEPGWICEIKFDGYRLLAEADEPVRLRTRGGADATGWFPEIAKALGTLRGGPFVFDGEVCVLDEEGRPDFDKLQDRARRRRWFPGATPVVYCIFDLLVDRGTDITRLPLVKRKEALARLLGKALPNVLLVGHFDGADGLTVFEKAVLPMKLEGLVAKRALSTYQPGVRSPDWVKVKRKGAIPAERFKR